MNTVAEKSSMKIITINVPKIYLIAFDALVNVLHLYPSRSEAMRSALRDFFLREFENYTKVKDFVLSKEAEIKEYNKTHSKKVMIPTDNSVKIYNIVKRLEF